MKKGFSLLLALSLVLTLLPGLAPAARAADYDAAAAADYADAHWNDGVGKADEFVRATLAAGGITIKSGTVMGVFNELLNYGVCSQLTLAQDGYVYRQDNEGRVAVGDVVFFACSKHTPADLKVHAAIVTQIASNGRVLCSQHGDARHNVGIGWYTDAAGHSGDAIRYFAVHLSGVESAVTVSFDEANMRADVGKTGASITIPVTVTRAAMGSGPAALGFTLYASDGSRLAEHSESGKSANYISGKWVVSERTEALGLTLAPETLYRYRGFVVVDGERYESADHYFTTTDAGATVEFGDWFVSDVTETDANLHASVSYDFDPAYKGGEKALKLGVRLYDAALTLLGEADCSSDVSALVEGEKAPGVTGGGLQHDWSVKDLKLTLTPGTKYYVQMFFRCGKTWYSGLSAFTAAGTAPVCTLSYNANGGTGAPEFQTAGTGESVVLSGGIPAREGYVFAGWADAPDAAYSRYAPDSVFYLAADTTLYAVWEKVEEQKIALEVHFPRQQLYFPGQFTDVPENEWYTDYVVSVYQLGLMVGTATDVFSPHKEVSLAQAITMAARIHSIYTTGQDNFVQGKVWYQVYVDYAYENGIIDSAYYKADMTRSATRAMFAEILANALPDEALPAINSFADDCLPDVKMKDDCAPFVYKLYRAGILTGSDLQGSFLPNSYIKRSECAAIIVRMAETTARRVFTLAPAKTE